MPSLAAAAFKLAVDRGNVLRRLATDDRLRTMASGDVQACLHAALASHVAAWEAYCESIVIEFFAEAADPTRSDYSRMHQTAQDFAAVHVKKFNTPNFDNSRDLILASTGFDPFGVWNWPARSRSVQWVRTRLNEVLQVRHAFAHGYPLPAYQWTTGATGRARLTAAAIDDVAALLSNLVKHTDAGLRTHLAVVFGRNVCW